MGRRDGRASAGKLFAAFLAAFVAVHPPLKLWVPWCVESFVASIIGRPWGWRQHPWQPLASKKVPPVAVPTINATALAHGAAVDLTRPLLVRDAATAEALDGLGERFGDSIIDGNQILAEVNPQMPTIRRDNQLLADLGEVYADAAPDLFDGLENAVTTARTFNEQQGDVDQALMAAVGFGNVGGDVLERGAPYFVRTAEDLIPTTALLDEYSPSIYCMMRNYHDVEPKISDAFGGNGYSLKTNSEVLGLGTANAYVFPDNLPRVNAKGGPGGRPGCWQPITRDLWPAPFLVLDTGASIAPYNHIGLGSPLLTEYVWGRQVGEHTINP